MRAASSSWRLASRVRRLASPRIYIALGSVSAGEYCLMNDLFTVPAARGQGVGRALILHCLAYAQSRGFSAIEWQTALDNHTAQRLYDSLPTKRTGWYTYELSGS